MLILYSLFPKTYKTDLRDFPARLISKHKQILEFQDVDISNTDIFPDLLSNFLELFEVSWCRQIWNNWLLEVVDTSEKSENHENDGFSGFPKMNPTSY